VTLQNFEADTLSLAYASAAECGLILWKRPPWPLPHLSLNDKSTLRFEIKTTVPTDKIGVSLKNTAGHEVKYRLADLLPGGLTLNVWYLIEIKVEKFSKTTRAMSGVARLECLTFFTNSRLSGSEEINFSVKAVEFL